MAKPCVCHMTSVHPAFDTRIFHKEAKTLAQAGYEVTLIAQHECNETVQGVRIIALPRPPHRWGRMLVSTWRIFSIALRQKAAVYHFHDPELIPIGILLKLTALARSKVIYDVHEDYPQAVLRKHWLPKVIRRPVSIATAIIERVSSSVFDGVVTATDVIAARFHRGKVTVVKNYAIIPEDSEACNAVRNNNPPTLIYVGALARERGIREMVQALELLGSRHGDVRMVLLGTFDDPLFEAEVRSLTGFSRVNYLGQVPHRGVYAHLTQADIGLVLIHPAAGYPEALPVKLFEYMAAALPVIASNFPLWREIVEGNQCGLTVDPLNPEEIATSITCLLENAELRRKLGSNGKQAFLNRYSWNTQVPEMLALYSRLAGNRGAT